LSVKPLKQFGQHFLTDTEIADAIIKAADIQPDEPIWEIGPGKGILTERILKHSNKLTAFEIDHRLCSILSKRFDDSLRLINQDVLTCDWDDILSSSGDNTFQMLKLISNLPYQITSPVLYSMEKHSKWFSAIVIMIQKEVADRLTAKAGTKSYGLLTLNIRFTFDIQYLFTVPSQAFNPPPEVESAVVMLTPRIHQPVLKSLDTYRLIINKAFAHRRKTLRNNLLCLYTATELKKLEDLCEINFNRRGETLEEHEFICLADCAYELFFAKHSAKQ